MVVKTVKMKERRRNAEEGREERKGRSSQVHKTVMKTEKTYTCRKNSRKHDYIINIPSRCQIVCLAVSQTVSQTSLEHPVDSDCKQTVG